MFLEMLSGGWCIYGKRSKDIEALNIKRFSKWIEKHHPYKDEYHRLLYNPTKWPYLSYLYGAMITDGYSFRNIKYGKYVVRIKGEKDIHGKRVNKCVENLIGEKYSIYKDHERDMYIINITRKSIYLLMNLELDIMGRIIEYNQKTMRAFILGLINGDGTYVKHKTTLYIQLLKAKKLYIMK